MHNYLRNKCTVKIIHPYAMVTNHIRHRTASTSTQSKFFRHRTVPGEVLVLLKISVRRFIGSLRVKRPACVSTHCLKVTYDARLTNKNADVIIYKSRPAPERYVTSCQARKIVKIRRVFFLLNR